MRGKVTLRAVKSLVPQPSTKVFLWDKEVPGFGVCVTPKGVRSYVLKYQLGGRRGRSVRLAIGRHGAPWTPDSARKEAIRLRSAVAAGRDPALERAADRGAPTLADFAKSYLEGHAELKNKPRTVEDYRSLLDRLILPKLGRLKVKDVKQADIERLHGGLSSTPYQANRALAVLSRLFNVAEAMGLRPNHSNPATHVQKYREQRRERFLSEAEIARLGTALRELEGEGDEPFYALAAIRFLLLTGCRLGEVLSLKWEYVSVEGRRIDLPDSKTGRKSVNLGAPAVKLLDSLPVVEGNPHVFPGRKRGAHLVGLPHVWGRVRERAQLNDVRLHDLRHSFASVAVASGNSLPIIGAILGHRQPQTTQRYAHLSQDPVQAAADRTAQTIATALDAGAAHAAGRANIAEVARS